jgi:ADP-ribose pyrophosphatase
MAEINRHLSEYVDLLKRFPNRFFNQDTPYRIITDIDEILFWQKQKRSELVKNSEPLEAAEIGVVFNDLFIIILRDLVEFPGGERRGYIRLINKADLAGGQGVVVVPKMGDKILLENHFRHPTRMWHLEFPRGFGEPGTSAEQQAVNEIEEEIGGKILSLHKLGVIYNNTGIEANAVMAFLAELSETGELSSWEAIKDLKVLTVENFEKLIREGQIDDGFTLAAFAFARAEKFL